MTMMKKFLGTLMALTLLTTAGAAMTQNAKAGNELQLSGTLVEVYDDGGFLMNMLPKGGEVYVKLNENVQSNVNWELESGDIALVTYNGVMTGANPPQISASAVNSESIEGLVTKVDADENRVLIDSPNSGLIWATLPKEEKAADYADKNIRVFTTGVMALSFPGQVQALSVQEISVETGTISAIDNDMIHMTWNDSELAVRIDEHTKQVGAFNVGNVISVYYNGVMTNAIPEEITGLVIVNAVANTGK